MRVGEDEADSTLSNALSMSRLFALDTDEAVDEVRTVARVVDGWKEHFQSVGVRPGDVTLYVEQIDRPFLREQREEFVGGR
jgi:serine/threonine-protein kinase HipA